MFRPGGTRYYWLEDAELGFTGKMVLVLAVNEARLVLRTERSALCWIEGFVFTLSPAWVSVRWEFLLILLSLSPFLMVNPPPFVTMIGGLVWWNTDSRSCSLLLSIPSWMLVNSSIVWPTVVIKVRWMNLPTEAHLVFGYRCRVGHRKFLCSLDRAQLDRFRLTDRNNII